MEEKIRKHAQAVQQNIHTQLQTDQVEKSVDAEKLTQEQFDQRYGSGHEVFEKAGVLSFAKAAIDNGVDKQEVFDQITSLNQVLVKAEGSDELTTLFVRPIDPNQDVKDDEVQ